MSAHGKPEFHRVDGSTKLQAARALGLNPTLCSRDGRELYRKPAAVIRRVVLANREQSNVF